MFLLRTTDHPVTDICFETGFGSPGNLQPDVRRHRRGVADGLPPARRRALGPICFAMAWTRPTRYTHPEPSSFGEARAWRASLPSTP